MDLRKIVEEVEHRKREDYALLAPERPTSLPTNTRGIAGSILHSVRERMLREIAAAQPEYLPAQVDLAETLWLTGKGQEARVLLDRIPKVEGVGDDLKRLRALPAMG